MSIRNLRALAPSAWLLLAVTLVPSVAAQRPEAPDQFIVSESWLVQHLHDPATVVLDVEEGSRAFDRAHIPGAHLLPYGSIAPDLDGLMHQLPPAETLRGVFEKLGVSDGSRVVVYASDAPMASRAAFTLDYLGGAHVSFLDGGLAGWRAAGQPVTTHVTPVKHGTLTPHPRPELLADASWIRAHAGRRALINTRTDGEYVGSGDRHGMPSEGHIAGARQLQWQQLFANPGTSALLPRDSLARLYAARVAPGDTVVTYCYVAYRASMTYMIARALGYPVKLYDGSYEDWSRRKLPLVAGAAP